MAKSSIRVVKIGGSLLPLPDIGERLKAWLHQQTPSRTMLIAGGGELADHVRHIHSVNPMNDSHAHWVCIDTMNTNAELLNRAMSVDMTDEIPTHKSLVIFRPLNWLQNCEPILPGTRLPQSWDVTSDSIAARLAICIGADELVLLKSADPPSNNLQVLSDLGYIDKFFPKLAAELPPWRMVNLRSDYCHSEGSSTT